MKKKKNINKSKKSENIRFFNSEWFKNIYGSSTSVRDKFSNFTWVPNATPEEEAKNTFSEGSTKRPALYLRYLKGLKTSLTPDFKNLILFYQDFLATIQVSDTDLRVKVVRSSTFEVLSSYKFEICSLFLLALSNCYGSVNFHSVFVEGAANWKHSPPLYNVINLFLRYLNAFFVDKKVPLSDAEGSAILAALAQAIEFSKFPVLFLRSGVRSRINPLTAFKKFWDKRHGALIDARTTTLEFAQSFLEAHNIILRAHFVKSGFFSKTPFPKVSRHGEFIYRVVKSPFLKGGYKASVVSGSTFALYSKHKFKVSVCLVKIIQMIEGQGWFFLPSMVKALLAGYAEYLEWDSILRDIPLNNFLNLKDNCKSAQDILQREISDQSTAFLLSVIHSATTGPYYFSVTVDFRGRLYYSNSVGFTQHKLLRYIVSSSPNPVSYSTRDIVWVAKIAFSLVCSYRNGISKETCCQAIFGPSWEQLSAESIRDLILKYMRNNQHAVPKKKRVEFASYLVRLEQSLPIIVSLDASASVFQIASIIANDAKVIHCTNLTSKDGLFYDSYLALCPLPTNKQVINVPSLGNITRAMIKFVLIRKVFGSRENSICAAFSGEFGFQESESAILVTYILTTASSSVKNVNSFFFFFEKHVRQQVKEHGSYIITLPLFSVEFFYVKPRLNQVRYNRPEGGGSRAFRVRLPGGFNTPDTAESKKSAQACKANLIHITDAHVMYRVSQGLIDAGASVFTIHDCFYVDTLYADIAVELYNKACVELVEHYSNDPVFKTFSVGAPLTSHEKDLIREALYSISVFLLVEVE